MIWGKKESEKGGNCFISILGVGGPAVSHEDNGIRRVKKTFPAILATVFLPLVPLPFVSYHYDSFTQLKQKIIPLFRRD
jgi:hypothetical protein